MAKIVQVGKTAVLVPSIVDASRPLLDVCERLIGYPNAKPEVQKARLHIEKAMACLDKVYSDVR